MNGANGRPAARPRAGTGRARGLVSFDCDGVLVDSMAIDMRELTRAIAGVRTAGWELCIASGGAHANGDAAHAARLAALGAEPLDALGDLPGRLAR